jgi:hypothetical protein
MNTQYEKDFYGWCDKQASIIRNGDICLMDFENLAEEIESMGNEKRRELQNRLTVLLTHILKWKYQPSHRGNSWRYTMDEQIERIDDLLLDNPSLKAKYGEIITKAYKYSRMHARNETGLALETFPEQMNFAIQDFISSMQEDK